MNKEGSLIKRILKENNKTEIWLSEQMGVHINTLYNRLNFGDFTKSERFFVGELLGIDLGVKVNKITK